ncbi:hypothetical protein ACFQ6S_26590 [Streptomyces sp. NPDC056479]|uniref:PP_RS20740 family protein n=1 Tax=Streptomyces sp. NPDC056479 TaxID=3345832 RepID=UPI00368859FC
MSEEATGSDESDDLLALLGEGPVPFPERTERKFQPWHRPRKQYVRRVQWCREIGFLARDLQLADRELRYLTLPGNDLLDIRHIAENICSPHDVKLRYLGFNSAAAPTAADQPELNAAQFSINRLDCIQPQSEVFPGDFRSVGEVRSVPWQRMRREGPFHAINIDLCGGFAVHEKGEGAPNYFAALQEILHNQESSDEEFLLFITTRMDDDNVDSEAMKTLLRLAQDIHDTCQKYSAAFAAAWGLQESSGPVRMPEIVGTGEAFMLGLTQWIIASGVSFGLKAYVRSFMTYRTGSGDGEDDIVSLAIRFKPDPITRPDAYGLARTSTSAPSAADKLCDQSAIVPRRVRERARVDEILRNQADEFERCIAESSALLNAAGYDASLYRDWLTQVDGLNMAK